MSLFFKPSLASQPPRMTNLMRMSHASYGRQIVRFLLLAPPGSRQGSPGPTCFSQNFFFIIFCVPPPGFEERLFSSFSFLSQLPHQFFSPIWSRGRFYFSPPTNTSKLASSSFFFLFSDAHFFFKFQLAGSFLPLETPTPPLGMQAQTPSLLKFYLTSFPVLFPLEKILSFLPPCILTT